MNNLGIGKELEENKILQRQKASESPDREMSLLKILVFFLSFPFLSFPFLSFLFSFFPFSRITLTFRRSELC